MPRLYFKYGTMGSSKSAQALMAKFNYEQKGMCVLLLKPTVDTRDIGTEKAAFVRSRIGLESPCTPFAPQSNLFELFEVKLKEMGKIDCVIVDEAQFCTAFQIDQLKQITRRAPVLCYGLMTSFRCELFEGSKRLVELADSITEIKSVCRCGAKSSINARIINGKATRKGPTVLIGGDETYENLCYWCWQEILED